MAFKSSSAALTPRIALSVRAVGRGLNSETSFSAFSSSGLDNMVAISFTFFLGASFESLKYAYDKDRSFGVAFPAEYAMDKLKRAPGYPWSPAVFHHFSASSGFPCLLQL